MPLFLLLETATPVCSVALARDGAVLAIRETSEKNSHAAVITLFIDEVMKEAGIALNELDAVAVSKGPGSYTGLRIGVATAKGLCYALEKPLIGVGTLEGMAVGSGQWAVGNQQSAVGSEQLKKTSYVIPLIDARRMEVYSAVYDENGTEVREVRAEVIDEHSFAEYVDRGMVIFAGDGAAKCTSLLGAHSNAVFHVDFTPSAKYLLPSAEKKFAQKEFEDLAYFEPFYLKDFVAAAPKVKGLREE